MCAGRRLGWSGTAVTGSSSTVGSVRLRLPAALVRGDTESPEDKSGPDGPAGSATATEERDAAGPGARAVRDEIEQKPPPPLAIPPAVTTGLLALQRSYRRAAGGERAAGRAVVVAAREGVRGPHDGARPAGHRAAGAGHRDAAGRTAAAGASADHLRAARGGAVLLRDAAGFRCSGRSSAKPNVADDTAQTEGGPDADDRRVGVPVAALLATVAIATGFGVWQAALRSEQVFGVGDPSVYLQYGYWIAKHGTARIPTLASSFGGTLRRAGLHQRRVLRVGRDADPGLPAGTAARARRRDVALRARRRDADARGARRLRGAVVRRSRGPAGRGAVGTGRSAGPRGLAARDLRVTDAVQRTAGPGAAVRRAVHVHRLVRRASAAGWRWPGWAGSRSG